MIMKITSAEEDVFASCCNWSAVGVCSCASDCITLCNSSGLNRLCGTDEEIE